jgi:hypothetical protein
MPSLQRLREYVEAANVARQRAHSERTVQGKQILQEIERFFRRLIESKDGRPTSNNIIAPLLILGCSTVTLPRPLCARTSCPVR